MKAKETFIETFTSFPAGCMYHLKPVQLMSTSDLMDYTHFNDLDATFEECTRSV